MRWGGVEAPLEDVAVDHDGTRHLTVALALLDGADVDEDRPVDDFVGEVFGLHTLQRAVCLRQQEVYCRGICHVTAFRPRF